MVAVVPSPENHRGVVEIRVDSDRVISDGPFGIGIFGIDFWKTVSCFLCTIFVR